MTTVFIFLFSTPCYRLPDSVDSKENFLQIAEITESLSEKSEEAHVKSNLKFLAGKLRSFVSSPLQVTETFESKTAELRAGYPSNTKEEDAILIGNTTDGRGFPEIQEVKCKVLDDQTIAVKRTTTAADGGVLKKLKYDLKYESKLDFRNHK